MTTHQVILWAAVLIVGASGLKNWTAGALAVAWLFGEAVYRITGDSLAVEFYLYPDIFVLGVIMAKAEACNLRPYESTWHQLKCILLERSIPDRIIILIYPVCWTLYVADMDAYTKWWSLYYLTLAQFLTAGVESFQKYYRTRAVSERAGNPPGGEFQFAWAVRGYG